VKRSTSFANASVCGDKFDGGSVDTLGALMSASCVLWRCSEFHCIEYVITCIERAIIEIVQYCA
jgi:hypothetical protein